MYSIKKISVLFVCHELRTFRTMSTYNFRSLIHLLQVTLKKVVKEVKHIPTRKLYYDYVSSGGKSYTWPLLILLPIITQSLFTITDIFFGFMVTQSVIGSSYRLTDLLIFAGLTIGQR